MAFGISFGKNNEKNTTDINKNTTGTQSGTENTSSTNNTSQTGTSNSSGSTTQQGTTTQNQSQSGTTTNQGTTTGSQSSFSDALQGGIEGSISQLLGQLGGDRATLENSMKGLQDFDAAGFINDTVGAASSKINTDLGIQTGGLVDNVGGSATGNSAVALLTQALQGQAGAQIAGVRADATKTAAEIQQGNLGAEAGALSSTSGLAPALINALKGGNVQSSETNLAQQISDLIGGTTGTSSQAGTSQESQQTQQNTIAQLTQLVAQLTNSSQQETGNQTTNNSKSGGGLSLGF